MVPGNASLRARGFLMKIRIGSHQRSGRFMAWPPPPCRKSRGHLLFNRLFNGSSEICLIGRSTGDRGLKFKGTRAMLLPSTLYIVCRPFSSASLGNWNLPIIEEADRFSETRTYTLQLPIIFNILQFHTCFNHFQYSHVILLHLFLQSLLQPVASREGSSAILQACNSFNS